MLDEDEHDRWRQVATTRDRDGDDPHPEHSPWTHAACWRAVAANANASLDRARHFAELLPPSLGVCGVVVFGSVARTDFNLWSDIDVPVVAEQLPTRTIDRYAALGPAEGLVAAVVWIPGVARRRDAVRFDRVESRAVGVWLIGEADLRRPAAATETGAGTAPASAAGPLADLREPPR